MRRFTVSIDGRPYTIDVHQTAADRFEISIGDLTFEAMLEEEGDLPGAGIAPGIAAPEEPRPSLQPRAIAQPPLPAGQPGSAAPRPGSAPAGSRADLLAAPMPGVILEVLVSPGDVLRRGDPLLVLEAMKMRNTIRSPRDAVVIEVSVEAGQPVGPGDPLVRLGAGG